MKPTDKIIEMMSSEYNYDPEEDSDDERALALYNSLGNQNEDQNNKQLSEQTKEEARTNLMNKLKDAVEKSYLTSADQTFFMSRFDAICLETKGSKELFLNKIKKLMEPLEKRTPMQGSSNPWVFMLKDHEPTRLASLKLIAKKDDAQIARLNFNQRTSTQNQQDEDNLAIAMSLSLMDNPLENKEGIIPNEATTPKDAFELQMQKTENTRKIYRLVKNHDDFQKCITELTEQYFKVNQLFNTKHGDIDSNIKQEEITKKIKNYINNTIINEIVEYYKDPVNYPKVSSLNQIIHLASNELKTKETDKKSKEYIEQQALLLNQIKSKPQSNLKI